MLHSYDDREAGVLLHISSLPGLGVLDANARQFVDWLAATGFSVWQMLPLGPTHEDRSPYLSLSSRAGNPGVISIAEILETAAFDGTWLYDYMLAQEMFSARQLAEDWQRYFDPYVLHGFDDFIEKNHHWLDDYATFMMLRTKFGDLPWWKWPKAFRDRETAAIVDEVEVNRALHDAYQIEQYLFDLQWKKLRRYANKAGIKLFGDMPLYVAHDSVDVWTHRQLFELDESGEVSIKAGVPPDAFSATGQVWGNPVYRWSSHKEDGFNWWIERIKGQGEQFDILRIDHFRGLQAYFSIPGQDETAENGQWEEAPGQALLAAVTEACPDLSLVAEDLGLITPKVEALRKAFALPGMRILEFAFDGGGDNPHRLENHTQDTVVYTGTHDNDTVLGWFTSSPPELRKAVCDFFGASEEHDILKHMISATLGSPGYLAIIPMQDILGLGSEARMNIPGTSEENWVWGFQWSQLRGVKVADWQARLEQAGRTRIEAARAVGI
ncbi:MAG: 4-alpha-glucanotransferase [bacterium]